MHIKQLTIELLIKYKKSYFETISALVLSTPLPDQECERILSKIELQKWRIFVAIDEQIEKIIWTCSIYLEQKLSKWWVISAQIQELAVHPDHQWKGIWSLLLDEAINWSRSMRCYKAILNCEEHNIWRYEKFWFEKKEVEMKMYL